MAIHFVNQYGNSKAVPEMFIGMTTGGTMLFFSIITALGLAWVWFFLPETTGRSLESIDAIFELPWYKIGRQGRQLTEGHGSSAEQYGAADEKKREIEQVEEVEQRA